MADFETQIKESQAQVAEAQAKISAITSRIEEARSNGASLPIAAMIDQFYAELQAMGAGRQDTSALVRRLPK